MATYSQNITQKVGSPVILNGGVGGSAVQNLCAGPAGVGYSVLQFHSIKIPTNPGIHTLRINNGAGVIANLLTVEGIVGVPAAGQAQTGTTYRRGESNWIGEWMKNKVYVPNGFDLQWVCGSPLAANGDVQANGHEIINTP